MNPHGIKMVKVLTMIFFAGIGLVAFSQDENALLENVKMRMDSSQIAEMKLNKLSKIESIHLMRWGKKIPTEKWNGIQLYTVRYNGLPSALLSCERLKWLKIVSVPMVEVDFRFNEIQDLKYLYLVNDSLYRLNEKIYKADSIKYLNVSGNYISKFDEDLFTMNNLQKLDLSSQRNDSSIVLSGRSEESKIINLNVSDCNIYKIEDGFFKFSRLNELDISLNPIESLPSDILTLNSLKSLNLSGTKLKSVNNELFRLPLESLDLSNSSIRSISRDVRMLQNLKYLKLNGTLIKELADEVFMLPNLFELYLPDSEEFMIWYELNESRLMKLKKNKYLRIY